MVITIEVKKLSPGAEIWFYHTDYGTGDERVVAILQKLTSGEVVTGEVMDASGEMGIYQILEVGLASAHDKTLVKLRTIYGWKSIEIEYTGTHSSPVHVEKSTRQSKGNGSQRA
jgi:hypothetical protein